MPPITRAGTGDFSTQNRLPHAPDVSHAGGAALARRDVVRTVSALGLSWLALPGLRLSPNGCADRAVETPPRALSNRTGYLRPGAISNDGPGQIGEFNFLAGEWKISHRMLKANKVDWDEVAGEATCWTILGGVGSVEELRIPARNFSGMGLRLLDLEKKEWSDYWCNAKSGVLGHPGTPGRFDNGVGSFVVDDEDDGRPVKIRGVWDQITATSCRWRQGTSRDGGATWVDNWIMHWVRA